MCVGLELNISLPEVDDVVHMNEQLSVLLATIDTMFSPRPERMPLLGLLRYLKCIYAYPLSLNTNSTPREKELENDSEGSENKMLPPKSFLCICKKLEEDVDDIESKSL